MKQKTARKTKPKAKAANVTKPKETSLLTQPLGLEGWADLEPVVLAALASEDPLLLIGRHGSAKSFLLERLAKADAIFHAAAVSDFAAGQVFCRTDEGKLERLNQGKLGTREGELLLELKPTPKIIASLRDWFAEAFLVGWKYEVDGDRDSALGQGQTQIVENQTNACVVNGPAYGDGFGWLPGEGQAEHLPDQTALFDKLASLANG